LEVRPGERRQSEIDGGGIEGAGGVLERAAEAAAGIAVGLGIGVVSGVLGVAVVSAAPSGVRKPGLGSLMIYAAAKTARPRRR